MRKMKAAAALVFGIAAMILMSFCTFAESWSYKGYSDASMPREYYDRIIGTLRSHAGESTGGGTCPMYDTGVVIPDFGEGTRLEKSFRNLFCGQPEFAIIYSSGGASDMYCELLEPEKEGTRRWRCSYMSGGTPGAVWVGWLPGSDPAECMRQHDEAGQKIQAILAESPAADDEGMYRYFFEWLCNNSDYNALSPDCHSAYAALVRGNAVCEGYARAFLSLCYAAGKQCILEDVITEEGSEKADHARNVVKLGDRYVWVDVTWGDQRTWICYDYLFHEMGENWQGRYEEPYAARKE